jgi:DNA (cytosine-5)-methyltransferase 1
MSSTEDKVKKRRSKKVELVISEAVSEAVSESKGNLAVPEMAQAKKDEIVDKIYTAVSLFSGMGGDTLGMTQAGCKVIAYNELKPTFCKTHHANFPDCELICDTIEDKKKSVTINDISKVSDASFVKYKGKTDVLFAGFPCFVKDTLVLTNNGYKEIQHVAIGDKLLTHTGKFQNIVNLQRKEYNGQLYNIKLKYHPDIISCTEEHPFYVREKKKVLNNTLTTADSLTKYKYSFGEPEWKNASKLTMNDYFGMVINKDKTVPILKVNSSKVDTVNIRLDNPDQWFTMGYFVSNGYILDDTHTFCFHFYKNDVESIDTVKRVLDITNKENHGKYGLKYKCANLTWFNILKHFGKGEYADKLIPEWIQVAPKYLVQEFINGYNIAANGYVRRDSSIRIVTESYNLAYGLQRLYLKLGYIASIDKTIRPRHTNTIFNGIRDTYEVCIYTEKQRERSSFIEGNYVWYAPYEITTVDVQNESVYNFEVETDNSYIVCNTIVHNCQGFSNAGKKAVDDPRNTLFLEFLRATKLLEPSLIIGENVKGLLSRKTSTGELYIDVIVAEFEKIGYNVLYQVFKTEKFNVPQSRERLIIIGVKKDNPYGWTPKLPTEMNCKPNLKSIVTYSMEGAVKVDPNWFAEIPKECIITDLLDTKVYPDNNGAHPYLMSMINADEASRFYSGKQHDYLFSFGKRNSPIHCEIVDIRQPSKTIICTYDHQPRLYVPIQNASGCYLRMFTTDELKQIQGFPSDYIVCGNTKEKIVQIGNAVPPPLIKAVVEKIINK